MQIESLKVFCDVVESKSFSKAAVLNYISQSAVSQQIRSLEERYEQKLIERGKRNLTPTQAGEILYEVAKDALARLETMEHRLRQLSDSVGGTVRVAGCQFSFISARKNWSFAVPVVAPAYCG